MSNFDQSNHANDPSEIGNTRYQVAMAQNQNSANPTPQSDETLDEILKTLHSKHYDTIDGADNCEVAVQEAKLALTAYIDSIVTRRELALLDNAAYEADKEYNRQEIDKWIFAFGYELRNEYLKRHHIKEEKGGV